MTKKNICFSIILIFVFFWSFSFGQVTGSGSTITITGAQTFDNLATWLDNNSSFGSSTESTLSITANITFASGSTLKRGTSRRNVIVFGKAGTSYRILSSSFTNANMGVIDFEGEGTFIFQGRGYLGSGAAMVHTRVKAENLDLIVSNTTGNLSYIDLFYRSANSRICLHVTEKLRVIYNNSIKASFGLTLDTNYQLGSVEQLVGKEMVSTQENPLLNGNNGTVVPPFTFIVTDTSNSETSIPWARNSAGNWIFNAPKILGDGDVIFKTWAATSAIVKNIDLPSTWAGDIKCFQQNGVVYTFTYDFSATDFDKAGWSIRVWDDTEQYISETLASDGDLDTKDIIWRKHTASGTNEQVITKRANTNIRMRLEGYEDLDLSYSEYNQAINYLNPRVVDANYSNTGTITEISSLDELYDKLRVWLADNLGTDNFLSVNGLTIDLDDYNLILDKTASNLYTVNTSSKTITFKADTLVIGDKFTSISTTGSITTQNSAVIEFGYEDNTGINKFVHLDWNQNTTQDVSVKNLSTNTSIVNSVSSTEIYKGHFLMPDPAPSSGIQVEIASTSGFLLFQEIFPEDDLNFIRTDINLNASEERQIEMLFLTKKLLQKSESINEVISGTTPNITDNTTVTNSNAAATNENQVAILQLLERILNKVSANREAFE